MYIVGNSAHQRHFNCQTLSFEKIAAKFLVYIVEGKTFDLFAQVGVSSLIHLMEKVK